MTTEEGPTPDRVRLALKQKLESLQRSGLVQWKKGVAVLPPLPLSPAGSPTRPIESPTVAPRGESPLSRESSARAEFDDAMKKSPAKKSIPPVAKANPSPPDKAKLSPSAKQGASPPESEPIPAKKRPAALEVIRSEVAVCMKCDALCHDRTNTVFGVGDPNARLCFIGEAPGADEDEQGVPFVGRAGQLLTDMIEKGMKLRRKDVYILNVLKCRPPGNRPPLPEEVANCIDFLRRQLEIIRPQFICCLGATAAQSLLQSDISIGRLRGRFHSYGDAQVLCTYHPSYLLRNPPAKKDVWEDLQVLMTRMGLKA